MTQEEKQLLLKDLCARVPYGVKFVYNKNDYTAKGLDLIVTDEGNWEYAITAKCIVPIEIDFIKPYLRPLSSITKEEASELTMLIRESWEFYDYLDAHHFDYRRLIEKELAIEAPEGMYD